MHCAHTHADPSDGIQGGSINLQDLTSGSTLGSLPEGSSGDAIPPEMVTSGSGDISSPDIINWEIHHTVMAGAALELLCQATGTPQPTVNWIRQGVQVEGGRGGEGREDLSEWLSCHVESWHGAPREIQVCRMEP